MAAAKLEAVPDQTRSSVALATGRNGDQELTFIYRGARYPSYLRDGDAERWIAPVAKHFCRGVGLDIGSGQWPLPGAHPIDLKRGTDAMKLPEGVWDFAFSSHCLEHLPNYVEALEHWKTRIRPGGVLFLYLPSEQMEYWKPQHCRKHLHSFRPEQVAELLRDLGFVNVIHSERDLCWSFAVVGWVPE
jgi:SAM-dependent methyltransferase